MIILYRKITDVFELQPLVDKSVSTLSLFKLIATGPSVSSIPNQFWCSEICNNKCTQTFLKVKIFSVHINFNANFLLFLFFKHKTIYR